MQQLKDGSWRIVSAKDLSEAVSLVTELQEAVAAAEEIPEVAEYLEVQRDIESLKQTIRDFMVANDIAYSPTDKGRWTIVRRTRTKWNADKLQKIVGPKLWKLVTRREVDPEKIDDLVREGKLDQKKIAPALDQNPERPYLRFFPSAEEGADEEAERLKEAMNAT